MEEGRPSSGRDARSAGVERAPAAPVLFYTHGHTCAACKTYTDDDDATTCAACGSSLYPACVGCGYDLAGLSRDGLCPECGVPIAFAYGPDLLRHRPREFVERQARGLSLAFYGVVACAVLVAMSRLVGLWGVGYLGPLVALAVRITRLGGSLSLLAGWWMMTQRDVARRDARRKPPPRAGIRAAVLMLAGAELVSFVLVVSTLFASFGSATMLGILFSRGAVELAWIAQFVWGVPYLRWLAERVPDEGLRAAAGRLRWIGPLLFVLLYAFGGLGPLAALAIYGYILHAARARARSSLTRAPGPG